MDEKGSRCFLDYFGLGINKDTTDGDDTCGLHPTDVDLLANGIKLAELDCASIISAEILSFLRVKCIMSIPIVELEVIFPQYLSDGLFSCEIRPTCRTGFLFSWIVCHTSEQTYLTPVDGTQLLKSSAATTSFSVLLFTMIVLFLLL